MPGYAQGAERHGKDYASCSGCGLCLLVCPVWRRQRDIGLTPLGRARALQHGAAAADIADSIRSCTLCAACEPVCPEDISLVEMTLDLRRRLVHPAAVESLRVRLEKLAARTIAANSSPSSPAALLPGLALRERPTTLARIVELLGGKGRIALGDDAGEDIALALEAGEAIPATSLEHFLRPLRGLRSIVVADGLLLRQLRLWLPQSTITSLGVALSSLAAVRRQLRANDLYIIEARAYHADYQRLVGHYDTLRRATGCALNLDLQRIAIPASARSLPQRLGLERIDDTIQARWILQGRSVARIVVESVEDAAAFAQAGDTPVVHLADLADDGTS
jgi:NAD-dependent dihydropyrimidine dehydrogenase PreA subunit